MKAIVPPPVPQKLLAESPEIYHQWSRVVYCHSFRKEVYRIRTKWKIPLDGFLRNPSYQWDGSHPSSKSFSFWFNEIRDEFQDYLDEIVGLLSCSSPSLPPFTWFDAINDFVLYNDYEQAPKHSRLSRVGDYEIIQHESPGKYQLSVDETDGYPVVRVDFFQPLRNEEVAELMRDVESRLHDIDLQKPIRPADYRRLSHFADLERRYPRNPHKVISSMTADGYEDLTDSNIKRMRAQAKKLGF